MDSDEHGLVPDDGSHDVSASGVQSNLFKYGLVIMFWQVTVQEL